MRGPYDDIISLPHHVSDHRPKMPMLDRAAQFAPFAALNGYTAAIRETERLTGERIELTEEEKDLLNRKLSDALADGQPVSITYFRPDERKAGGAYVTAVGRIKRVDTLNGLVLLVGGPSVPIQEITDIRPVE